MTLIDATRAGELDGLSCPVAPLGPQLLATIVGGHAEIVLSAFLERYGDWLYSTAPLVDASLRSWTDRPLDFATAWHPAFGDLHAVVLARARPGVEVLRAASTVQRRLSERRPSTTPIRIASPADLSPTAARRLLEADAYSFASDETAATEEWQETLRSAMALLDRAAPQYVPWVHTVVCHVIPLAARSGCFNSGGERCSPGVVCVSNQPLVWPLAEMLVHEATHQYMHIAMRLGAFDDGSDETQYYSPFRDKDRPLPYILIAYHAFGNVLLFYRTARKRGLVPDAWVTTGPFADREATLESQLRIVEPVLRTASTLTELGEALWRPLARQLQLGRLP